VRNHPRTIIEGDRASFNAARRHLPQGVSRPLLRGLELLPEVMSELGQLKVDPDDLILSPEGAKRTVLGLAQNHLDYSLEPHPKDAWKKARGQLNDIRKAAKALHLALGATHMIAAQALLRTGAQINTQDFLHRLERLAQDVDRALEFIPKNNMGDAITALSRLGTPNEMLLLGCQNLLFACGHKAVGATVDGALENLVKQVKRLALGADCSIEGFSAGAMRSPLVKGRSRSKNLKIEALFLILGDVETRRGRDSELYQKALDALVKLEG